MRVEFPGAIYHVMSRGDRREDIFLDDVDRQDFLKTLAEACQKTGWRVHAFCLMGNHFHLVVETPNANLVSGMRWLLSAYSIRLNNRHKLFGHVFSGRYKALLVDGSASGYLKTVCDYVHLNPVRARLLKREERLLGYPWSSMVWYVAAKEFRPGWIRVDRVLGEHGLREDTAATRQEFERRMEARRLEETDEDSLQKRGQPIVLFVFALLWGRDIVEDGGAAKNASGISRGDLPRDEPRGSPRGYFSGRRRPAGFPENAGGGLPENRLAGACVLPDGKSFSPGG
jgi:REP element-mobilizing transposase RayT